MAPRYTRCAQVRPDGELSSAACQWDNPARMAGTYLESQQKYGPRAGRVHRQVSCLRCCGLQKARTNGSAQFREDSGRRQVAGDGLFCLTCRMSGSPEWWHMLSGGPANTSVPVILLAPSAYAHTSPDLIGLAARLHTNTDTKEPRPLEGTSALDWKADAFATHQAENISYTDRAATLPHQPPSTRAGALGTRSGFSQVGTLLIAVALGTGWLTSIRSAPVAGGTATDVLTVAVLPRFRYQTIQ